MDDKPTPEEAEIIKAMENKARTEHSKGAIFLFFIFGAILIKINGLPLLHYKTFLFFIVGHWWAVKHLIELR